MHFEIFHFVLTLHCFGVVITQRFEEIEVALINIFGDVDAVEHRAFKLLDIRDFQRERRRSDRSDTGKSTRQHR